MKLHAAPQACRQGVESGARNVDNILTNSLLPEISRKILSSMAEGEKMSVIHVSIDGNGDFDYQVGEVPALQLAEQPS